MEELILENGKIYYESEYDGGGSVFGINCLKNDEILKNILKGKILEMCSGPGFMGFYLNFEGLAKKLVLADINPLNNKSIQETIKENRLENVEFYHSNLFSSIPKMEFDTIISNPPHFLNPKIGGYKNLTEQYISLDEDMMLHKSFFIEVLNYIHKNSKIIMVENCDGVSARDIIEMASENFDIQITEPNKYGWQGKSLYYVAILQLKK
jgi:methylase of polypeptide subunit release factors